MHMQPLPVSSNGNGASRQHQQLPHAGGQRRDSMSAAAASPMQVPGSGMLAGSPVTSDMITPRMAPVLASDLCFTSRFTVSKSSWRGRYTRIFAISATRVATIDPKTIFKVTNSFEFARGFVDIVTSRESPLEFSLMINRGNGKTETMNFSCHSEGERAELLTDVRRHQFKYDFMQRQTGRVAVGVQDDGALAGTAFETRKSSYNEVAIPEVLRVTCVGVERVDKATNRVIGEYLFYNIKGLSSIEGRPTTAIVAHGPVMKLHLYDFTSPEAAAAFVKLVVTNAQRYIALPPYKTMKTLTADQFLSDRFGIKRELLETAVEFSVLKMSKRSDGALLRRLLGTTSLVLVERDPATYNTVGAYFLSCIFSLVRCADDDQKLCIHFKDPANVKVYTTPQRDAFLAHLVDACRAAGNLNVSVVAELIDRGKRSCSLRYQVTEDLESTLLGCLCEPEKRLETSFPNAITFFNANIEYCGLRWSENKDSFFAENREKRIYDAIYSLLHRYPSDDTVDSSALVQQFQALRRLSVSRTGFSSIAVVPALAKAVGVCCVRALQRNNMAVTYAAIDFLNTLMTPMHNHYEIEHESINKNRIASASSFVESLLLTLRDNIYTESAALVVQELLNFFVYVLCPPYSESTDAVVFHRVMEELVKLVGKGLFPLLGHPCHAIRYASGQLIRVVMEEGSEEQFRFLQRAALTEGGVLMEFNVGAFGRNRSLRDLARRLLAYWAYDNTPMQDLLRRMMPLTLLNFLQSTEEPPAEEKELSPSKHVTQMTQRFRESKNGWFKRSFHSKNLVAATTTKTSERTPPRALTRSSEGVQGSERIHRGEQGKEEEENQHNGPGANAVDGSPPSSSSSPAPSRVYPKNEAERTTVMMPTTTAVDADGYPTMQQTAARMRVRHVNIHTTLNWSMLFYQLKRNHLQPDLIWNHTTRDELRHAIEGELEAFQTGAELRRGDKAIAWNYQEFEVVYHSLDEEIRIGQHYYPRLLFDAEQPMVARPAEFFNELYRRFLLVEDAKGKMECLRGMSLLYKLYPEKVGEFSDLPYLVRMFEDTVDPTFRDHMLTFFSHALGARHNIKIFLDCNALAPLAEQVTLAQLHIDRPQVHAVSNAIEYGGASLRDLQGKEKEWYYSKGGAKADPVSFTTLKELFRQGDIDENTKVWAQGMSGWKALRNVPQLRWGVVSAGKPSVLTYTEVTCTILDIFQRLCDHYPTRDEAGAIMQPLPRVKRYLSSPAVLPHLVQLLLTFDSTVCSRVHRLLYSLMQDNPLINRFFLTGVFYFSLLYTASDVLPMARLLYLAHRQQAFQYASSNNTVVRGSILAPLLPAAMICFLTHNGPEKFADALLGEYETPEIIWGKDMRRYLAGKVAAHIADFTPQLLGNNLVQYQYCPIVGVEYEPLQHELFCSEYYLRHLCDEGKYPNWPIRDPVMFLRDVLTTWRDELEKKPSLLTREGCLAELGLTEKVATGEALTPQLTRKAYFALAAEFHPDKNPNGRERFERIQEAYELLAAEKQYSTEPDPKKIRLLLQSQSILFRCYGDALKAYKYAGYALLLSLIKRELADEKMLTKEVVLMEPATELCFATVKNVPLNADELQEEGGMRLLATAAERCFEHVKVTASQPADAPVKIATQCMLTFAVSGQFKDCRAKLLLEHGVPYLAAKGVAYHGTLMPLARACIQCCETLCLDRELQSRVAKAGAIWHLMRLLFCFDPTLATAGVELEEKHHAQLFANRAALFALKAVYSLVGFHPDKTYCQTARDEALVGLLRRLLTPYIVHKMETVPQFETAALTLLNGNYETPYFLWNNSSRAELGELLVHNSEVCRNASIDATAMELPSYKLDGSGGAVGKDGEKLPPFSYSLHVGEVIVGGVFVRIYVAQPSFPIEEPAHFANALLDYIAEKTGMLSEKEKRERRAQQKNAGTDEDVAAVPPLAQAEAVADVVTCFKNLTLANPDVASGVVAQRMSILVQVFASYVDKKSVLLPALELLDRLLPFEHCMAALGKEPQTASCLAVLLLAHNANTGDEEVQLAALQALRVMLSHRPHVQQALDKGLYVVLLVLFATGRAQAVKEAAAACLGKAFSDKLFGPKLYLRCGAFLPNVFLDTMRDTANPGQCCVMLDTWQENPELLWTKDHKAAFVAAVSETAADVQSSLTQNPAAGQWTPKEGQTSAAKLSAEKTTQSLEVGGVVLSLFLQQAGWQVRRPKEFLVALLDSYLSEVEKVKREQTAGATSTDPQQPKQPSAAVLRLNLMTDSGVRLLSSAGSIRDYAAGLGYLHKLVDLVGFGCGCGPVGSHSGSENNMGPGRQVCITALRWLHELWKSSTCVEVTSPKDVLLPLLQFFSGCADVKVKDLAASPASLPYLPLLLESLEELFANSTPRVSMVALAMQYSLVELLLRLLESGVPSSAADSRSSCDGTENNGGLLPPSQLAPAAARALIIKVVKAMLVNAGDLATLEKLNGVLGKSAVWAKYKDQSHELFLTQGNAAAFGGYLTAGSAVGGGAGTGGNTLALTVAAANPYQNTDEPPPLQD